MFKAAEMGLKSWVEEHGLPKQTKAMLGRKKVDGIKLLLSMPVINEGEVRCALPFSCPSPRLTPLSFTPSLSCKVCCQLERDSRRAQRPWGKALQV